MPTADPINFAYLASLILFKFVPFVLLPIAGYILFSRSEMGRALIARWRRDADEIPPVVEQELDRLREELMEVHERLDFSERMLTELRPDRPLPPPSKSRTPTPPEAVGAR